MWWPSGPHACTGPCGTSAAADATIAAPPRQAIFFIPRVPLAAEAAPLRGQEGGEAHPLRRKWPPPEPVSHPKRLLSALFEKRLRELPPKWMIGHPIRGRIEMTVVGLLFGSLEVIMRETGLAAAAGFLLLGASDLGVDLLWLRLRLRERREPPLAAEDLPPPLRPGPIAVFIPAWDEAAVIGAMLRRTIAAWAGEDVQLYVGCYPNDPATIAAVRAVED